MSETHEMIQVINLRKRFGRLLALDGVNLTVRKGQVVVIIGPSGSGKSTLLRCINHLETPTEGEIWIERQKNNWQPKTVECYPFTDRNGFSTFQPLPSFNCFGKCNTGAEDRTKNPKIPSRSDCTSSSGAGGNRRKSEVLSGATFRRTAAACSHRAGACTRPQNHVVR